MWTEFCVDCNPRFASCRIMDNQLVGMVNHHLNDQGTLKRPHKDQPHLAIPNRLHQPQDTPSHLRNRPQLLAMRSRIRGINSQLLGRVMFSHRPSRVEPGTLNHLRLL